MIISELALPHHQTSNHRRHAPACERFLDFGKYLLIYVAATSAFGVAVLVMVRRSKSKHVVKIWGTISTVLTVTITVIGQFQPAWVATVAQIFYGIESEFRIVINMILIIVIFLIVYDVQGQVDQSKSQAPDLA